MGVDERCRVYSFFRILDSKLEPEVQFCLKVVLLDVWFSQETSWSYINRPWSWCEEVFFVGTVFCPCFCTSRPFQLVWKGICNQISWIEWRFTHCKWDLNPYTVDDIYTYIYIYVTIYIYIFMITVTFISSTFVCMSYHPSHISPPYSASGTVAPMNSLGLFELSDVIHSVSRTDSDETCGWGVPKVFK